MRIPAYSLAERGKTLGADPPDHAGRTIQNRTFCARPPAIHGPAINRAESAGTLALWKSVALSHNRWLRLSREILIGAGDRSPLIKAGVVRIWMFCARLVPCPDPVVPAFRP